MRGGCRKKALGCGGHQRREAGLGFRRIETAAHQVNPHLFRRHGLLGGFHMDVGQLTLPLQLEKVMDSVLLSGTEHGSSLLDPGSHSNPHAWIP